MIVNAHTENVFPNNIPDRFSLEPKIISVRHSFDDSKNSNIKKFLIELYCFVDQRKLYTSSTHRLCAFLSKEPLRNLQTANPSLITGIMGNTAQVNKVIYNSGQSTSEMINDAASNLYYLTDFPPFQYASGIGLSDLQTKSDVEIFGTTDIFEIARKKSFIERARDIGLDAVNPSSVFNAWQEGVNLETFSQNLENTISSTPEVFRRHYNQLINSGIDPMSIFDERDSGSVGLVGFLKGCKKINKSQKEKNELRLKIKEYTRANYAFSESLNVSKTTTSKKLILLKTTVEYTVEKLLELKNSAGENLIIFAKDRSGNKIDSTGYNFDIGRLIAIAQKRKPKIEINVSSIRNRKKQVISNIQNLENKKIDINVYTKKVNNYYPNVFSEFTKTSDISIEPRQRKTLVDGAESISSGLTRKFSKSCAVFHRYNFNYEDFEISNSRSSYVASDSGSDKLPYCAFYCKSRSNPRPYVQIYVNNVSEEVMSLNVVRRVVNNGNRAPRFSKWKIVTDQDFIPQVNLFTEYDLNAEYNIRDYDIHDGNTYEYAVKLTTTNGQVHYTGHTSIKKFVQRKDLVDLQVTNQDMSKTVQPGSLNGTTTVAFTVRMLKKESDVDRILGSIFGDDHELFRNELKEIKDSSNLIFGVKVNKINKTTGQTTHVGDFKARKTSESNDANEGLQPTVECDIVDVISPFFTYAYEIKPYIIPPSHIIDKVKSKFERGTSLGLVTKSTKSKLKRLVNRDILISSVGTKYGSLKNNQGQTSSNKTLIEIEGGDLFSEGLTGDDLYHDVTGKLTEYLTEAQSSITASLKKINYFSDEPESSTNIIKNSFYNLKLRTANQDRLIDFYIILKKENTSKQIFIEGAIHSRDDVLTNKSYNFIVECDGSFGDVEYYTIPVLKNGVLGKVISLGKFVIQE